MTYFQGRSAVLESATIYRIFMDTPQTSGIWFLEKREIVSGQIIATSHDLTPNGGLVREMGPLISGKLRLVKYYNLARLFGSDLEPNNLGPSSIIA